MASAVAGSKEGEKGIETLNVKPRQPKHLAPRAENRYPEKLHLHQGRTRLMRDHGYAHVPHRTSRAVLPQDMLCADRLAGTSAGQRHVR